MKIKEIVEGKTRLIVPIEKEPSKKSEVFFNPEMEFSRDISVLIAKVLRPNNFCDALASTGARGIRIANEVQCNVKLNDINPKAVEIIKKNAFLNNLKVEITQGDANSLLINEKFDWVDIDPFGSPIRFLDSALISVEHNGILAVTATDTAALSGTYPSSCLRKYSAFPLRTDYYNELGLRIFLGYLIRTAAKYEKSLEIIFSHCTRHYYRAYAKVKKSKKRATLSLGEIKFIQHCFNCMNRELKELNELEEKCSCGAKFKNSGPIFSGKFADEDLCKKILKILNNENFKFMKQEMKLIRVIAEEQKITLPYYNLHKLFKKRKLSAKSMEEISRSLNKSGFLFSRTHFSSIGIKTDAKVNEIYKVL
ncbi:MAG: tRNA (guanine(10)-N(2))-dimethyltransferase [Candidatus Altiarchaeota archaeon]